MDRLTAACASEGLRVVLPVNRDRFDAWATSRGAATLKQLWSPAQSALVVGDGGPQFYENFRVAHAATDRTASAANPLDDFTEATIAAIASKVWGDEAQWRAVFPFAQLGAPVSFQQLGIAAGLPAPGPLGLQIHPEFGPWWAYRCLLLTTGSLPLRGEAAPPIAAPPPSSSIAFAEPCQACHQPCVTACFGGAVNGDGFAVAACGSYRLNSPVCESSCAARLACPVGTAHRHSEGQIAFHMKASLVTLRRYARGDDRSANHGT